jgi:hypothetical protein
MQRKETMKWIYIIAVVLSFFYLGQVIEGIITGRAEQTQVIKLGAQP